VQTMAARLREGRAELDAQGQLTGGPASLPPHHPPQASDPSRPTTVLQGVLRLLEHLVLIDFTQVTDKGVLELCTLTSLRELSINGWSLITDHSILMIAIQMKRLDMLTLVRCQLLTNSAVVQLSSLARLRRLNLQHLPWINHECLWALSALPLQLLRLSGCCIIDTGAGMLLHIPTLRELNIVGCGVTRRGLRVLYRGLPATQIVMLDQDEQFEDD
jgi:hypothetical protein